MSTLWFSAQLEQIHRKESTLPVTIDGLYQSGKVQNKQITNGLFEQSSWTFVKIALVISKEIDNSNRICLSLNAQIIAFVTKQKSAQWYDVVKHTGKTSRDRFPQTEL